MKDRPIMTTNDAVARDAGQVLMGGFEGRSVDPAFAELVRDGRVGGAILFGRNIESPAQAHDLLAQLTALPVAEPLMYAVDQEGGRVQRLRAPFPELPTMRVLGGPGRKTLALRAGELLGQALQAIGFHQNFAPVLDVDSNPDNPVIGDRAFSRDPNVVARLGAAFIDGMQTAGVAACGKHFPGHGDTDVDSHKALPRLDHDLERLREIELVPFRAAAAVEAASLMTAHVLFTALDEEHPATLSPKVLGPLVRQEVPFRGVVVSDDLEMRAIADHYGTGDAAVRAIAAGCDQLLICRHPALLAEAHEALVRAVESGRLDPARLAEAAGRVRTLKDTYVRPTSPAPDPEAALAVLEPHREALWAEVGPTGEDPGLDPTERA